MIKKSISILIITAFVFAIIPIGLFAEEKMDCTESMIKGETYGRKYHDATGAFLGGMGAGILLGLIGTGIATAIAASSSPMPDYIPNKDVINEDCYIGGYQKGARKKNINNAIGGGLVGTVIIVTTVLIIASSSSTTSTY